MDCNIAHQRQYKQPYQFVPDCFCLEVAEYLKTNVQQEAEGYEQEEFVTYEPAG